jgi:hypothetical protein
LALPYSSQVAESAYLDVLCRKYNNGKKSALMLLRPSNTIYTEIISSTKNQTAADEALQNVED